MAFQSLAKLQQVLPFSKQSQFLVHLVMRHIQKKKKKRKHCIIDTKKFFVQLPFS